MESGGLYADIMDKSQMQSTTTEGVMMEPMSVMALVGGLACV